MNKKKMKKEIAKSKKTISKLKRFKEVAISANKQSLKLYVSNNNLQNKVTELTIENQDLRTSLRDIRAIEKFRNKKDLK